jgi:peptide/nickel transport system substrate-binding protein
MRLACILTRTLALLLCLATPAAAQVPRPLVWGDNFTSGMDPHAIFDVPSQFVLLNVYDGLYRYQGNDLVPWLAEGHTVSPDGLTWDFRLREGIRFHDGSAMTGEDVVWSFRRLLALNLAPAAAFSPVLKPENITAPDARTVRFVLNQVYAPFLAAMPVVAVVNPRVIQPNIVSNDWGRAWLAANEAGSGAYRFDPATYRARSAMDLERFPQHFMGWTGPNRPIDSVRWRDVLETSTRVLALLRGEIDSTDSYLPTDQVERIDRNASTRVARDQSMRIFLIRMNNRKPPFDNIDARLCFAHAFNYQGFIDVVLKGLVTRNGGPLPNNLWGNPPGLQPLAFDLVKAKAHCDKARAAGAPMGREIELHTLANLDQTIQAAQMFQADLRRVGVSVKIVPDTMANIVTGAARAETTPDMWIHWISAYFIDPENWIGQMYDSRFHGTWKASAWYSNPRVDDLLTRARTTLDQAQREALYQEASRVVIADSPDIWVYNTVNLRGLTRRVQGYNFSPVGSGGELRSMWFN